MEPETPKKTQVHIQLTPSTKQFMCIVCGERKNDKKDRQKIIKGSTRTDLYDLIEKLLQIHITQEGHSDICCRSCVGRLMTVEKSLSKFKSSYESTREKLLRTHGHTTVKRAVTESGGQRKRKALFVDTTSKSTEETEPVPINNEELSSSITDDREFPYSRLVDALMHGNESLIVNEIMAIDGLASAVKKHIFKSLREEVKLFCARPTNSLLRQCDKEDLLSFCFKDIANEWVEHAPLFHNFLIAASTNTFAESRNKFKKGDVLLQTQVAAGCKLLNSYSKEMKSLQAINGILFLKGGMKKAAFNRMQSTSDCHSYSTAISLADKLANDWDVHLKEWKQAVETDNEREKDLIRQITYLQDTIDLCSGQQDNKILCELVFEKLEMEKRLDDYRSLMHPGYYFVGDNVDMVTKVRQMTSNSQNKDQHMYQMCAYVNRVSGNHLDNTKPLQDPQMAPFSQLVPGDDEKEEMITNFSYLVAKKWCQYLTYFTPFDGSLPDYIEHEFIKETTICTKRVNMGVLKKNEAKNEDMVDICKFLHKYVPGHDEFSNNQPVKTLSGGDYLTFERHRHAQMSLRNDATPSLKLEGLIPKMEEFHNQAELLKVIWTSLYSTVSSRDIGTMFAARNITNSRNVTADPSGNFYASSVMVDKFSDAYIVAGALEHFNMDSVTAQPQTNIYNGQIGDSEQMKAFILLEARKFVTEFTQFDIPQLPTYGPQCLSLKCRSCDKIFTGKLRLRKHEHKAHGREDPRYLPKTDEITSREDSQEDMILNYTKLALFLCLLRMNHNDALNMGDGERIMAVNQYLILLYKAYKFPKYAYGLLETNCQSKILLSARMAHRLKWNRTVNHRGKRNTNHPNDLDLEHCNRIFKDEAHSFRGIFTEKTISRVSRSALCTDEIARNFDKQTHTKKASGIHTDKDMTEDVYMVVTQLLQQKVFKTVTGRSHTAFPAVSANPFDRLPPIENVRDWVFDSMKRFADEHFYSYSSEGRLYQRKV